MLDRQLVQIAMMVDDQGNPIEPQRKELTYLLLFFADNPDTGEEEKTFEIVDGRDRVCDTIMEEQGTRYINLMKSQVISEKVTDILNRSISCYTFLRFCLDPEYQGDNPVLFGDDGEGNYMSIDVLNNLMMSEYADILEEMGIYDEEDLDRFYQCDFNHIRYEPKSSEN
ncbi:MAG: hypothetical protein IJ193_09790 [Bacilli bacterium]|nr:hypothetical protein [Bacilli bacterium]